MNIRLHVGQYHEDMMMSEGKDIGKITTELRIQGNLIEFRVEMGLIRSFVKTDG